MEYVVLCVYAEENYKKILRKYREEK